MLHLQQDQGEMPHVPRGRYEGWASVSKLQRQRRGVPPVWQVGRHNVVVMVRETEPSWFLLNVRRCSVCRQRWGDSWTAAAVWRRPMSWLSQTASRGKPDSWQNRRSTKRNSGNSPPLARKSGREGFMERCDRILPQSQRADREDGAIANNGGMGIIVPVRSLRRNIHVNSGQMHTNAVI